MLRLYVSITALSILFYVSMPGQSVIESKDAKYVSYLTHSGLNNQRIGLENAILVAYILNRTLIIPPLFLGKAVPWKSYSHLKSLVHQRTHQVQRTRRKCIDEVTRRIALGNATVIRDSLYVACRKPTRELTKWSMFVDFKFLKDLNISFIEMDALHYPDFNISDTTVIKDDELYSYKLFDTNLDLIHHHQFEYFDITVFEDNKYIQRQPIVDTPIYLNSEIQSSYLGKYKIPLEFSFLKKFNHSLLQFGSLFGSSRLGLYKKHNLKVQSTIQKSLIYNNPLVNSMTNSMKSKLGSFVSVHYRSTESSFVQHRSLFMKHLDKELRTFTSLAIQQLDNPIKGLPFSTSMNRSLIYEQYKTEKYDFNSKVKQPEFSTAPSLNDIKSIKDINLKMEACRKYQNHWFMELKDSFATGPSDAPNDAIYNKDLIKLLPKQLPVVIYVATDVKSPRSDVFLRNHNNKYPCTFYLQDFKDTDVLKTDPLMIHEINQILKGDSQKPDHKIDLSSELLAFGKGNLYYAFVDQLMAGSGTAFYGTEGSTFSQMSGHVYLKECSNDYLHPLELIKGYSYSQLWVKNRRRILKKMAFEWSDMNLKISVGDLESWLKYMPFESQLKIVWEYLGCGYMKML
eukprot:NODE_334_length_10694_cov_0.301180.p1 type:complete len:626 gc:universal NODE_334_length_10694_cov_0.301180:2080-203(-)